MSTIGSEIDLGAGEVLAGDLVDVVVDRERAGDVGLEPGPVGLERRRELVVVGRGSRPGSSPASEISTWAACPSSLTSAGVGRVVVGDDRGGGAAGEPATISSTSAWNSGSEAVRSSLE